MSLMPRKAEAGGAATGGRVAATPPRRLPAGAKISLSACGLPTRPPTSRSVPPAKPATPSGFPSPAASQRELSASIEPDSYLCPDLVVPASCECVLRVPLHSPGEGPFGVTDMHGSMLFHVALREPESPQLISDLAPIGKRIVLTTGSGDLLAQCFKVPPEMWTSENNGPEFHLLRPTGEYFGQLVRSVKEDMYTIRLCSNVEMYFWGSFQQHAVNVTDNLGRLLAMSEMVAEEARPSVLRSPKRQQAYKLRVAPLMDVSIVLCGLLCIDHLM